MSLKILGGEFKGLTLNSPFDIHTRPTSVMLRRKIFDARQDLDGYHFIDAFAGTGSIGFEALSRGASSLTLIENNLKAFNILTKNRDLIASRKIGMLDVRLLKKDFLVWLKDFARTQAGLTVNTIIYIDPPYDKKELYISALTSLLAEGWYQGEVWLEACRQKTGPISFFTEQFGQYFKVYEQGTSYILVFK
jgi:16S rRNA (guanine966-N2)-methyltransferase